MPIVGCAPRVSFINHTTRFIFRSIFNSRSVPNSDFKTTDKMYPRVKVRDTEQEECVYPKSDSGSWAFLKFIESIHLEGILKNSKGVGDKPKENLRACSVIRPRAVLSSPENDGLIGSINDLNNKISSTQGKKDARGNVGDQAKVLTNHVKVGKSWGREEGEAFKGKAPSKAKCTFETFDLKRGHA